jgi:hypothetical protein
MTSCSLTTKIVSRTNSSPRSVPTSSSLGGRVGHLVEAGDVANRLKDSEVPVRDAVGEYGALDGRC